MDPLTYIANAIFGTAQFLADAWGAMAFELDTLSFLYSSVYRGILSFGFELTIVVAILVLLAHAAYAATTGNFKALGRSILTSMFAVMLGYLLLGAYPAVTSLVEDLITGLVRSGWTGHGNPGAPNYLLQVLGPNSSYGVIMSIILGIIYIFENLLLIAITAGSYFIAMIMVFFTPLIWAISPKNGRRMLEFLIFLMFVPFFIEAFYWIGVGFAQILSYTAFFSAVQMGSNNTLVNLLSAISLLVLISMVCVSPFMIYKFIPLVGDHMSSIGALYGSSVASGKKALSTMGGVSKKAATGTAAAGKTSISAVKKVRSYRQAKRLQKDGGDGGDGENEEEAS